MEIRHKLADAALGVEDMGFTDALVNTFDAQAPVQIGQFLKTLFQRFIGKFEHLKDFLIRLETDCGAVAFHTFTNDCKLIQRHAARVMLPVTLAVTAHRDGQLFGKRIDAGHAHAMQTAGHLVAGIVKLAAGMQLGHDHLDGGHAFLGMDVHRNAAPVIAYGHGIVRMQNNRDVRTIPGHGFVNGVIHHLINEMMQAAPVRGAYIHGRTLAHGGKAFQNGNGRGRVVAGGFRNHYYFLSCTLLLYVPREFSGQGSGKVSGSCA